MKSYLAILFLGATFCLYGQEETQDTVKSPILAKENFQYYGAYFGNFIWNPGLKLSVAAPLKTWEKEKEKKRAPFTKNITKEFLLNGEFGFYFDPRSHVGVFSTYGFILRKTNEKKRQFTFKLNPIGVFRSFYPETYKVTEGQVEKVFLPGRSYYAGSLSLGTGKLRPGKKLSSSFLNLNLMILAPHNINVLPIIAVEYGFRIGKTNANNQL